MRLIIAGVGRMKSGPERELLERYLARARALSRGLGIVGLDLIEVDEGRGRSAAERQREEAAALAGRFAPGVTIILLDERGRSLPSVTFAERIGTLVAGGAPALALVIGGPDGFDDAFRSAAPELLSFGAATLPHQLLRVVLAEQVYRALTILSRHPYHRA